MDIFAGGSIINYKIIIGPIGKLYTYYTIWENNILANIHIDGVRAIFLLFVITKTRNLSHLK